MWILGEDRDLMHQGGRGNPQVIDSDRPTSFMQTNAQLRPLRSDRLVNRQWLDGREATNRL